MSLHCDGGGGLTQSFTGGRVDIVSGAYCSMSNQIDGSVYSGGPFMVEGSCGTDADGGRMNGLMHLTSLAVVVIT